MKAFVLFGKIFWILQTPVKYPDATLPWLIIKMLSSFFLNVIFNQLLKHYFFLTYLKVSKVNVYFLI